MNDDDTTSSDKGGLDHLNSWYWSHVDRIIGWWHNRDVT